MLNKSANFEYGRLKKLNEDDFVVSLLKSRQSKRVIVMFAVLQAFFMSWGIGKLKKKREMINKAIDLDLEFMYQENRIIFVTF